MVNRTNLTSAQIRAARALLNWSARHLSEVSGVSQSAIHRAETAKGSLTMHEQGLAAIKITFERFGVEFLQDCGLRLRAANDRTDANGSSPGTRWMTSSSS